VTDVIGKSHLPSWLRRETLEIGPAPTPLIATTLFSLCLPFLGWIEWDMFSRQMQTLFHDPAGLSWAGFAVLWSILGQRVDVRILVLPLLIAWCWGAGEAGRNLELLLPHLLWASSCLTLQNAGWFRLFSLWIALDAIWVWYSPFLFPSFPWTCFGPITLALNQDQSHSQMIPGVLLTIALCTSAGIRVFFRSRVSRG